MLARRGVPVVLAALIVVVAAMSCGKDDDKDKTPTPTTTTEPPLTDAQKAEKKAGATCFGVTEDDIIVNNDLKPGAATALCDDAGNIKLTEAPFDGDPYDVK